MDKEKEIQEMADIVEIYCSNHFDEEVCENPYKSDCDKCIYCALVEAGYRKADEVRKETVKEVLQKMYDIVFGEEVPELGQVEYGIGKKEILYIAKSYSVEIDE